jgi:hypothetical protein
MVLERRGKQSVWRPVAGFRQRRSARCNRLLEFSSDARAFERQEITLMRAHNFNTAARIAAVGKQINLFAAVCQAIFLKSDRGACCLLLIRDDRAEDICREKARKRCAGAPGSITDQQRPGGPRSTIPSL